MRWLLDQGVPRSAAGRLRQSGADAVHTGEIGMAAASDAAILQRALVENRVVVTLDSDFHQLLALTQAVAPSVIRIRLEGLRTPKLVALLDTVRVHCEAELRRGAVVSVTGQSIRVRLLPLP
jgi:predicted nuclease of predicted toxin-antitoxin system